MVCDWGVGVGDDKWSSRNADNRTLLLLRMRCGGAGSASLRRSRSGCWAAAGERAGH